MKITPAYVRSEMNRINETLVKSLSDLDASDSYAATLAWTQSNGSLRGLLDSVLTFGLESEMI